MPTEPVATPDSQRPVTAVAAAGHFDLNSVRAHPSWRQVRRRASAQSFELPDGNTLFAYKFGAIALEGAALVDARLRDEIEATFGQRLLDETSETYYIAVDPERAEGAARVGWDRVVIPERSAELIGTVALLLAQSSALERYELATDSVLEEALALSQELAQRGRLPRGTRPLIERVGRLTSDRLELARWFYLVDRPAETWEDSRVSRLYDELFDNLELRRRREAMLHKLEAAERATETTIGMWHGRRANALEWAIVMLIVVEIVFGLWHA